MHKYQYRHTRSYSDDISGNEDVELETIFRGPVGSYEITKGRGVLWCGLKAGWAVDRRVDRAGVFGRFGKCESQIANSCTDQPILQTSRGELTRFSEWDVEVLVHS